MFGSMMRDFEEDPFFSSHRDQVRRMEQMMGSFMSPFDMGFPRLMGPPEMGLIPRNRGGQEGRRHQGREHRMMPFGFGGGLFPPMDNMFQNIDSLANDPNCHSYSSSSVFTYSTDETGTPQVYQASSSTQVAPGGVKETRRSIADSQRGIKKMAIGHHLGERAHIVERSQENGQQEESQEFENIEEEEAESFNREWMNKARRQPRVYNAIESDHPIRRNYINDEPRALPAPPSRKRDNEESRSSEKRGKKWPEKLKKSKQPKNDED